MEISREQMNAKRPELDEYGNAVLERMNRSHNPLYLWGESFTDLSGCKKILDIGCGGGKNIFNLAEMCEAELYGMDISEASVAKTLEINAENAKKGRVKATVGSAENIPFSDNTFDLVTAFETVYYWNSIESCFRAVRGILKEGGTFLVCNEDRDTSRIYDIAKALDMNLYTAEDLKNILLSAGFKNIRAYEHENGRWICALGEK